MGSHERDLAWNFGVPGTVLKAVIFPVSPLLLPKRRSLHKLALKICKTIAFI